VIVLDTARLRLRWLQREDDAFILELMTDPQFLANVGDRGVRDLQGARRYIEDGPGASYRRFGFGLYAVELKAAGVPLGLCGLLRRDSHPDVELGFAMLPRARRLGYTSEAAAATLGFAFNELHLQRIVAITAPHNHASMHILQRLGMRPEGRVNFTADGESQLFAIER
jgi:[ribosomal protein S5]-alanine N-acetyltransferase